MGATALGAASAMAASAGSPLRMKIGCSTVSFRKSPLAEALERIRRAGFEYVEVQATGAWCPHVDVWNDDPQKFARQVRDAGFLGVSSMWAPKGAIISTPQSVEGITRAMQWAKEAGIPVINAGDGRKPASMSDEDALKLLGERLAAILEVAEKCHVYLAIEPHGTFSLTAAGLKKILGLTKSKWLGINYDTANVNHGGEDEVATLRAIVDRVVHVHVKDTVPVQAKDKVKHECVALGKGKVNVLGCLRVLKEHGYSGMLSLETEGEFDAEEAQRLVEASRSYLLATLSTL
jgi:sugar phosphate isomerase/epimerase